MARPKNCRIVASRPIADAFKPMGCWRRAQGEIILSLDEFEAIRLADHLGMQQDTAARHMSISRPTFTRIYDSARKKVAHALVEGKILTIDGGHVEFDSANNKDDTMKKIAIPTSEGRLFGHFGRATLITFVTVDKDAVVNTQTLEAPKHEHGSLPKFLKENGATDVIVNSIGPGAKRFLEQFGIALHAGAPLEPVMDIVQKFMDGTLVLGDGNCNHHEHHHEGEEHKCGGNCGHHH